MHKVPNVQQLLRWRFDTFILTTTHAEKQLCFFLWVFFSRPLFWFLGSQLQLLQVLSHCAGWFQPYDKIISLPERRFYLNIWIALICIAFQSEFSQWCVKGNRYGQCLIIGWACHFGLVSQFSVVKLNKERRAIQFNGFSPFLSLLRRETERFFCSAWGSWCTED